MVFLIGCQKDTSSVQTYDDIILDLRSKDCVPDIQWSIPPIFENSYFIELESYPGCQVALNFYLGISGEFGNGTATFHFFGIDNFIVPQNTGLCSDFYSDLAASIANDSEEAFWNSFYDELYVSLGIQYAEGITVNGNSIFWPCSDDARGLTSNFYSSSCYQMCSRQIENSVSFDQIKCGDDCCTKVYQFCYDKKGNLQYELIKSEGSSDNCGNNISVSCEKDSPFNSTDCIISCQ